MTTAIDLRQITRRAWETAFTPPERLTVSQWADKYRYLSPESASAAADGPVRWKTTTVPYLRAIMDALGDPHGPHEVVFAKSAQVGGSSAGENWLGWIIQQRPSPALIVWPTEKKMKAFSTKRLDPMLRDTPVLAEKFPKGGRRDSHDSIASKQFPGGYLQNLTAKSSADLRAFSARFVDCEEVDEWETDVGGQGDPIGMVQARVLAFPLDHKIYYVSTPGLEGHSKIWPLYESSSQGRYLVPCPTCNGWQVLEWQAPDGGHRFVWEVDEAGAPIMSSVRYRCSHCDRLIDPSHRDAMVAAGEWRHTFPNRGRLGFHIWSAYSPFVQWGKLVFEGWDARRDSQKMKTFVTLWLGLPYKPEGKEIAAHYLKERSEPMAVSADGEILIPHGVGVLTAATDVQGDRLEFALHGWGEAEECWHLVWLQLEGDPGQDAVWEELGRLLQTPFTHVSGQRMRIATMAVDARYQKKRVLDFCDSTRIAGAPAIAFPTMGKEGRDRPILTVPGPQKKARARSQQQRAFSLGVDSAKDLLASRLRIAPAATVDGRQPPGFIHFADSLDPIYYDQLTSERLEVVYTRGRPDQRWVKIAGRRNEALDLAVMNMAALAKLGTAVIKQLGALAAKWSEAPTAAQASPVAPVSARRLRSGGFTG